MASGLIIQLHSASFILVVGTQCKQTAMTK